MCSNGDGCHIDLFYLGVLAYAGDRLSCTKCVFCAINAEYFYHGVQRFI